VALVTDAGTPGISDPGNKLVEEVVKNDIRIVPIPGPSGLTTLASVAGIDMQKFVFLGFPPHKKGRETFFKEVVDSEYPVIYYDSVHRFLKNLELLNTLDPEKNIILGRELTKMFEEIVRGSTEEVLDYFGKNTGKVRGEFVIIVY
jgi:16S rRNA (cytidine1402-2'-O)-methyltransferase